MGRSRSGSVGAAVGAFLVVSLGEAIAGSPAIAGGRIYIRGDAHLFAIGASTPARARKS